MVQGLFLPHLAYSPPHPFSALSSLSVCVRAALSQKGCVPAGLQRGTGIAIEREADLGARIFGGGSAVRSLSFRRIAPSLLHPSPPLGAGDKDARLQGYGWLGYMYIPYICADIGLKAQVLTPYSSIRFSRTCSFVAFVRF